MFATAIVTDHVLVKGEKYPLVRVEGTRLLIIIKGWKVSYPASKFEPIEQPA